ncbi:hypothetical protein Tco_0808966 [Tanacetum coccineum]
MILLVNGHFEAALNGLLKSSFFFVLFNDYYFIFVIDFVVEVQKSWFDELVTWSLHNVLRADMYPLITLCPSAVFGSGSGVWFTGGGVDDSGPAITMFLLVWLICCGSHGWRMQRSARKDVVRPLWDSKLQQSCR